MGAMMEHETSPVFDVHDPPRETFREVVSAWVVIIILLVVTSVAFFLDHAATMEP
jgi:hypothetical protein